MQKIDEKLRKAEEIYCRRNGIKYRRENVKNKSHSWYLILVALIVLGIYLYENNTTILNENIKNQIKSFLNTPVKIESIVNFVKAKKKELEGSAEQKVENKSEDKEKQYQETNKEENASEIPFENEKLDNETISEIIWPYKGEITSGFGERLSEDTRVSSNHTGIDIAGNERRRN